MIFSYFFNKTNDQTLQAKKSNIFRYETEGSVLMGLLSVVFLLLIFVRADLLLTALTL
uniref:Uncharacterized protein n=1 Tax=Oryza brachyantha TaxID=4533 RepID=J3N1G1_ORYBR